MRYIALIVAVVMMAVSAAAQEYDIKFDRPLKAGVKYKITALGSASIKSNVMSGGNQVKSASQSVSIDFEGQTNIIEVNQDGKPTKKTLQVEKCVLKMGDQESTPLEKGIVITISPKDTKSIYEVNGAPVDKNLADLLELVEHVYTGSISDDDVFGSKQKRKVGDSWEIMTDKIPADALRHGVTVDQKNISGTTKLEKVEKSDGLECLALSGEMTIKDFTVPLPPNSGMKVESSAMLTYYTGLFPTNLTTPCIAETMEMKVQTTISGRQNPNSQEIKVINTVERKSNRKYSWGK